jgi:hypothetical protein
MTPDPVARLEAMAARFAPVDLEVDLSALPDTERRALRALVEAAQVVDALFLRQVWSGNETLLLDLARDGSLLGRARLDYFLLNKGPWSRLDDGAPFMPGVPAKPPQANFYPDDATRDEVAAWFESQPTDEGRAHVTGFFTAIRRGRDRRLVAVPYSVEYQDALGRVAERLRAAAAETAQPTLQAFLESRADAFLSNDYYASDVAWMHLDASLEPTIGPYEVYEDEWFNAKAAFEGFVAVRDDAATARLARFGAELQAIEDHLPIDSVYRNPTLGTLAPIRVVNTVFSAGDANRGVQTAAFNLPNDERILTEHGAKRVMLRNNQAAKFEMVLRPIAAVALATTDQQDVAFDAFFTHILMHELMHGLGPHTIETNGRATTVRQALGETYSAIEEAKADVSGLWAMRFLIDRGALEADLQRTMYTTYLASMFRSLRFGVHEAHGRGVAIQLNRFLDDDGVRVASDGTYAVVHDRIAASVTGLTHDIMTLQAEGDVGAAKDLIARLGVLRPPVKVVLDRLDGIPVDIRPRFVTAEALLSEPLS